MTPLAEGQEPHEALTSEKIVSVLWESLVEGFVSALLVSVLGGVAVSVLGAICGEMLPSAPPLLRDGQISGPVSSATLHAWWHSIRAHGFAILFALFFLHTAWMRLSEPDGEAETGIRAHLRQALGRISKHWFRLTVGNAIGALISATVLVWVQQFSLSRLVWHAVLGPVLETVHSIANHILGPSRMDTVGGLISWFGENQFKFTFWILYMAAVCDDLGLPNVKTLGRGLWRRVAGGEKSLPALDKTAQSSGEPDLEPAGPQACEKR